ncbi:MAG: hypothetical protein P4M14_07600 [Gammaproteobacteria bacterium]|nr:hypothetical protein [Gammaproteobacteria bacterium]
MSRARTFEKPIDAAIFFDWDGVLHLCADPEELEQKPHKKAHKGAPKEAQSKAGQGAFVGGKLLDPEGLTTLVKSAKKFRIPFFVITARPESHKDHIINLLKSVDGFQTQDKDAGGFHLDNLIFLGIEKQDKNGKKFNLGLQMPKAKKMDEVREKRFSHLPKENILAIDDDETNTKLMREVEYSVIDAESNNPDFLKAVQSFMQKTIESRFSANNPHLMYMPAPASAPLPTAISASDQRAKSDGAVLKANQ